jgi:predicted permease
MARRQWGIDPLRTLVSRCAAIFRRGKLDRDLDEELAAHLAMAEEGHRQSGMNPEEARQAALRDFGGVTQVRETMRLREGLAFLENLRRDIGYSLRQMRRSPGFAVVTVLTLALGIGANSAIFLLTYSLLLKSLPVPNPSQLVRYSLYNKNGDLAVSYPLYEALRAQQGPTSGVFAWDDNDAELDEHGSSSQIPVGLTTGSALHVLGLRPYLGRGFEENAGERGQPLEHEALVSYGYWKGHLNRDPHILGQILDLNHTQMTIVGVLPPGFSGISPDQRDDLLLPLSFERVIDGKYNMIDQAGAFWLQVMGRLKPGATLEQARAALSASQELILRQAAQADPRHGLLKPTLFGTLFWLGAGPGRTGESGMRDLYSRPLVALEALCGLMMLLCAVNVALLVLARVSSRLHEFAVRSALGAGRGRLMSQVLMETTLLGVGGLALGGYIGWELAHALVAMITNVGAQPALNLRAGAAIVLFAALLSLGAALLAGLWPAWRASHTAPAMDLKQARMLRRSAHAGRWLIPAQVAMGIVLIYAAVLLTGTLRSYLEENSGFVPNGVTFAGLNYQNTDAADQGQVRKAYALAETLRRQPGIESAALLSMPPVRGWFMMNVYFSRGAKGAIRSSEHIWDEDATEGYFETLGTRILEGRGFTQADVDGDKVCVISRSAAQFFFPGVDPIGQFITEGDGQPPKGKAAKEPPTAYRVIGVAEDARMQSLEKPAPMMLYGLYEQEKNPFVPGFVAVRSSSDALAAETIRRETAQILPGAVAPQIYTFDRAVEDDLSQQRLLSSVSSGFALLALGLVGAGLFGVLSRAVTERRREIGIRMALGAQRDRIVAALARGAALRVGLGAVGGAGLAVVAGRLLHSLLYGVSAASPMVGLVTLGLLLAVLTVAFIVPAGRAASVQPMEAIREE